MTARILVIEDNPESLELMMYLLESLGHTALHASNGEEGIYIVRTEVPDLILCDVQLPGIDGHEVCRRLKSDAASRGIPLVAITACAMVGDREKMLAEGFNEYFSKPINPEKFMTQIAPFLGVQIGKM